MIHHLKKTLLTLSLIGGLISSQAFAQKQLFPEAPGMVSFTYRNQFAKDVPGTLDMIKSNGVTDIEFSNLFKQTPENLRKMCDERGIKCSSYGVSYDDLVNKTDEVGKAAKTLGATYVRVAGIPHKGAFTLDNAKQAVADFNKYGKLLKDNYGLTFIYHNHGFEYQPYEDGTLYDYLVKNTDPKYVSLELDILWAFFPGQDPAALLAKYGNRYKALHMKDLKKGVERGSLSGGTAQDNDVILGTGQIDIPAVIKAARKAGVKHYYIEDESSASVTQVPESIKYLNSLKKD
ncbi:sugar phosphate isomerase/epimerase family protein [Mucilaginibacter boryungensis]|uniref:Sugar phosphate isomerase/epimerase n=1 Tax=Mucilaginibacter boryungensis TaxID=768480 RepID=A0ABR9XF59_9SPHI|nr:sugar phosphate isomerase/epimerase [Mucilaginibacter boryungensis]MBE9665797.1 sugar phosphate isomerase/epimerase [Mucilaginibacter boryungensis]